MRAVTPALKAASDVGLLCFEKPQEPLPKTTREYEYRHQPVELLQALRSVFSRGVRAAAEDKDIAAAIPQRIVYSEIGRAHV